MNGDQDPDDGSPKSPSHEKEPCEALSYRLRPGMSRSRREQSRGARRTKWTSADLARLAYQHSLLGNKWTLLARIFHKTDAQVKNIFHSVSRSKSGNKKCAVLYAYANGVSGCVDSVEARRAMLHKAREAARASAAEAARKPATTVTACSKVAQQEPPKPHHGTARVCPGQQAFTPHAAGGGVSCGDFDATSCDLTTEEKLRPAAWQGPVTAVLVATKTTMPTVTAGDRALNAAGGLVNAGAAKRRDVDVRVPGLYRDAGSGHWPSVRKTPDGGANAGVGPRAASCRAVRDDFDAGPAPFSSAACAMTLEEGTADAGATGAPSNLQGPRRLSQYNPSCDPLLLLRAHSSRNSDTTAGAPVVARLSDAAVAGCEARGGNAAGGVAWASSQPAPPQLPAPVFHEGRLSVAAFHPGLDAAMWDMEEMSPFVSAPDCPGAMAACSGAAVSEPPHSQWQPPLSTASAQQWRQGCGGSLGGVAWQDGGNAVGGSLGPMFQQQQMQQQQQQPQQLYPQQYFVQQPLYQPQFLMQQQYQLLYPQQQQQQQPYGRVSTAPDPFSSPLVGSLQEGATACLAGCGALVDDGGDESALAWVPEVFAATERPSGSGCSRGDDEGLYGVVRGRSSAGSAADAAPRCSSLQSMTARGLPCGAFQPSLCSGSSVMVARHTAPAGYVAAALSEASPRDVGSTTMTRSVVKAEAPANAPSSFLAPASIWADSAPLPAPFPYPAPAYGGPSAAKMEATTSLGQGGPGTDRQQDGVRRASDWATSRMPLMYAEQPYGDMESVAHAVPFAGDGDAAASAFMTSALGPPGPLTTAGASQPQEGMWRQFVPPAQQDLSWRPQWQW